MKFGLQSFVWLTVLLALVMAGVFAFLPKPITVETASAVEGPLQVSVEEDGKTRIREKYIVSAPVAGRLSRIELRAGDSIDSEKTLLAVILPSDPEILDVRASAQADSQVHAAEASLERARSTAEQMKISFQLNKTRFERSKRLMQKNAASQDELDLAEAEYTAAVQAHKTAKFDCDIAKFELDMANAAANQFLDEGKGVPGEPFEIYAPVSGKVLRVFQESATALSVGTPLLEMGDPQNLEIEIDVLSTDAVRIKPGAELSILQWGGEMPLRGTVRVVEPAAFTKISSLGVEEQRVNVIADFNEPAYRLESLGDGYRIEAQITIHQLDNVLKIPNSALFRHQRQWHVFQSVDGIARLKPVSIGLQNNAETEISDGLKLNDQIILFPSDELKDGARIQAADKNLP